MSDENSRSRLGLTSQDLLRVNVVGTSGCGKSTFSKRLAGILDSPYFEMDQLFHGPNWTEPELEVFQNRIRDATSGERWVLDGNYHSKTYEIKWPRTTTVVWIDTPFIRNLWQTSCRAMNRAWTQKELWPGTGNRESFRQSLLSTDSIILWMIMSYPRIQKRYSALQRELPYSHLKFVRLTGKRAVEEFFAEVEVLLSRAKQPKHRQK